MRWSGVRLVEIFCGGGGEFCGAALAAEIKGFPVVEGLRCGTVGVDRHPADRVFFGCFYVLLHFVGLAEGLDSRVWYRTLEQVGSEFWFRLDCAEQGRFRKSICAILEPVRGGLLVCFP
jgi:hypothetical protein